MRAPRKVTIQTSSGKLTYAAGEKVMPWHEEAVAKALGIKAVSISQSAAALLALHPEIEPSQIRGSGKEGKITKPDVERALRGI